MELQVIATGDSSHTVFNPALNETYHSRHGALAESRYVFIQKGLNDWLAVHAAPVRIFEVGFGTGLNALLTLQESLRLQQAVIYHSIEKFPLDESVLNQLNYGELTGGGHLSDLVHSAEWDIECVVNEYFTLKKISGGLHSLPLQKDFYDIIFFDAFAPTKQPEMWTPETMQLMYALLQPGGYLVTYCSQGQFKRNLKSAGFVVEALAGPPGKREMTRALKPIA